MIATRVLMKGGFNYVGLFLFWGLFLSCRCPSLARWVLFFRFPWWLCSLLCSLCGWAFARFFRSSSSPLSLGCWFFCFCFAFCLSFPLSSSLCSLAWGRSSFPFSSSLVCLSPCLAGFCFFCGWALGRSVFSRCSPCCSHGRKGVLICY